MASAATSAGLLMDVVVMSWPVAATVPTVEANPHTMAGSFESRGIFEACTMAALPTPTVMAAVVVPPPSAWMTSSVSEAMAMPVRFEAIDLTRPSVPAPRMKKEAQAMKMTQTGMVRTVAVISVAAPPSTPILIDKASSWRMAKTLL